MKHELEKAEAVAKWLVTYLSSTCSRIEIAGSIRRRKPEVGDIEILYVPKMTGGTPDLFGVSEPLPATDVAIGQLLRSGVLAKRKNSKGSEIWGDKNKLALHVESGIPVDLFATSESCWHNYLVCRTGPAESNMRIAKRAQDLNLKWKPYGEGFETPSGKLIPCASEEEVFAVVGLHFSEPRLRA
jgi:DNA polymerase/3'-5' exonuclease PolX